MLKKMNAVANNVTEAEQKMLGKIIKKYKPKKK